MPVIPNTQAFEGHGDGCRRRISKGILPQTETGPAEKGLAGLFRVHKAGGEQFEHWNKHLFGGVRVGASASRGLQRSYPLIDSE
jgi:hypothetical protein